MAKKDRADKKKSEGKSGKSDKPAKTEKPMPAPGQLAMAMTQVARSMRTRLSHGLAECGLYPGQDGVIQRLADEDGQTAGALALGLGVKAPTMTRTIARMEAQGFVRREADARDARVIKVFLTDDGRACLGRIRTAMDACEAQAVLGLRSKDVRQLYRLLSLIDQNLASSNAPNADGADLSDSD